MTRLERIGHALVWPVVLGALFLLPVLWRMG